MKKTIFFLIFCFKVYFTYAQNISITQVQPACNYDGIVEVNTTNISIPYVISVWYSGGYKYDTIFNDSELPIVVNDFGGGSVSCNVYTMQSNQYSQTATFPSPFEIKVSATTAVCPILGEGLVTVTGGTAPFSFEWTKYGDPTVVSTDNPASLPNGSYTVKVTDSNGCVITSEKERDSTFAYIYNTPNFTYEVETTDADCTNGSAKIINLQGGSPPFTYEWSNGSNASEILNLTMGYYNVVVTGSDGCSSSTEEININQSIDISVNFTETPVTCEFNDGKLHAFPSGGKEPYQFIWSNGANTALVENLATNYYNVRVIDANGCIGDGYKYLYSYSPVNVQILAANPSACNQATGSITLSALGGQAPYTIKWLQFANETNFTLDNLQAGNYSFIVTDANGCEKYGSAFIANTPTIYPSFDVVYPTCENPDGRITALVSGGTLPYSFEWNNGSTNASLSNIIKGFYQVTITDAGGCSITKGINIPSTSPLSLNFATTNASCIYNSDGAIAVNVLNGTAPFSYNWSNGSTNPSIGSLHKGEYRVYVKDAQGCEGYGYSLIDYDQNNNSCYCLLTGSTYLDANENCILEGNELPIQHLQIKVKNFGYVYSNSNGIYEVKLPTGTYQVTETVKTKYPLSDCEPNTNTITVVAAPNCVITKDFANIINPIRDLNINLWPVTKPIPGYEYKQKLIVSNQGTINEAQILTKLNIEDQIPIFFDNPTTFTQESTTNYIGDNLPTLKPGESYDIDLTHNTPVDIPLNTEIMYRDSCAYDNNINNWLNDYSPSDNVGIHRDVVVGSYDPNFIEVHPQGSGEEGFIKLSDDIQNYMVHFENEGSWYAQKVVVKVHLDASIDIESIEPIYQSHVASIMVENNGNLVYTFNNIQLQPKSWGGQSQGMFSFRCKLKEGRKAGDLIRTDADIYFDFNAPIATNKTLNTIEKLSEVFEKDVDTDKFTISPNPGYDYINLKRKTDETSIIEIQSINGIRLLQTVISGFEQSLDVSQLSQGMYIIKGINKDGKQYSRKFIKM